MVSSWGDPALGGGIDGFRFRGIARAEQQRKDARCIAASGAVWEGADAEVTCPHGAASA